MRDNAGGTEISWEELVHSPVSYPGTPHKMKHVRSASQFDNFEAGPRNVTMTVHSSRVRVLGECFV